MSTNEGRVFAVEFKSGGVSFNKEIGFKLGISDAILDVAYDPKTKYLGLATGTGHIVFLAANQDEEWKTVNDQDIIRATQIPALSIGLLQRGQNVFVVAYANGTVKLLSCETGILLA